MEILVLNGTYRPEGTTTALARAFMEGARAAGAETEMILLRDRAIGRCTNCLKCYATPGDGIAPCGLKDDMDAILARIAAADGVLFASPVHNGFVTGLMTDFWERLSWRAARPGGPFLGGMALISRMAGKPRALGSLASAGGMSERLRKYCDDGTPWLKSNASLILHGQWIGDVYAGADLERLPESAADWSRLYFLRRLSARQKQQAYALGEKMARAIRSGRLKPVTMEAMLPSPLRWILTRLFTLRPAYRLAD